MKKSGFAAKIIAVLFLVLVFGLSLDNAHILEAPVMNLLNKESDFATFTQELAGAYRDELEQREDFISWNGAYARLSGARVSNDIILLNNGMLTEVQQAVNTSYGPQQLKALNEYLEGEGIPFLYVQAPRKPDIENVLVPTGAENKSNENTDQFMAQLAEGDVPAMDLRPCLSATEEMIEQYFYVTDHHWNVEGAFVAFQQITAYMQELFPDQQIVSDITDRSNWTLHVQEDYFLGSHGRRVGIGFAGLDDLIYLTPDFETELSCSVPDKHIFRKGTFAQAALDSRYMSAETDYYNTSPYCIHTGGDFARVQFRNAGAPADLKVLLLKDSFGLPLEGLLATAFREVETLDLRHLKDYTAVEIMEQYDPDMVIVMYNSSFVGGLTVFDFGLDEEKTEEAVAPIIENKDYKIPVNEESDYNHTEICTVENGKTYTLTIDAVEQLGGESACFVATLYDADAKKRFDYYSPDLAYIQQTGGEYRWVFNTPQTSQGELTLLIYSAIPGKTAGTGIELHGVSLYSGAVYE